MTRSGAGARTAHIPPRDQHSITPPQEVSVRCSRLTRTWLAPSLDDAAVRPTPLQLVIREQRNGHFRLAWIADFDNCLGCLCRSPIANRIDARLRAPKNRVYAPAINVYRATLSSPELRRPAGAGRRANPGLARPPGTVARRPGPRSPHLRPARGGRVAAGAARSR